MEQQAPEAQEVPVEQREQQVPAEQQEQQVPAEQEAQVERMAKREQVERLTAVAVPPAVESLHLKVVAGQEELAAPEVLRVVGPHWVLLRCEQHLHAATAGDVEGWESLRY